MVFSARPRLGLVALAGVASMIAAHGCATDTDLRPGLRPPVDHRVGVDRVAVAPFVTESDFGLPSTELRRRLAWAERAAYRRLRAMGADAVPARRMRARLRRNDALAPFRTGGMLHDELNESFEGARAPEKTAAQFGKLSKLDRRDVLPSRYVLFGELVYHTETECRTRADRFTSWSSIVVRPAAPPRGARPCLVTHFRARLVDARAKRTLWFGRHLVEHHVGEFHSGDRRMNVESAVDRTLNDPRGLSRLLRGRSR